MAKKNENEGSMSPGNMKDDDTAKGIVSSSGNYFSHHTGTTRISVAPVAELRKLCPKCLAGERNYPHPYKADHEERICPGVSINPHGGKDGSGIQPRIRNLSERAPVQPDTVERGLHLGKYIGGLVLHLQQNTQAVTVHRVDTPSDPGHASDAYVARNRERHIWGRPDRVWNGVGAMYIGHEPFVDGIVPTMLMTKPPSMPHVIDKRAPKTGAVEEGSTTVSPPRPAVVSADKVDKRTATSLHISPEVVRAPDANNSGVPQMQPKAAAPVVKSDSAIVAQNGDTILRTAVQAADGSNAPAVPSGVRARPVPGYAISAETLAQWSVKLPIQQLLFTERGELFKPDLIYNTGFVREAANLSKVPEDALGSSLAILGMYRCLRSVTSGSPPVTGRALQVAKIFAPSTRETAALLDLLDTPVSYRRTRAEEILAAWTKDAKALDSRANVSDLWKVSHGIMRITWDLPYARSFMKGLQSLEQEQETHHREADQPVRSATDRDSRERVVDRRIPTSWQDEYNDAVQAHEEDLEKAASSHTPVEDHEQKHAESSKTNPEPEGREWSDDDLEEED